jgi:PPM family protein phosphatase
MRRPFIEAAGVTEVGSVRQFNEDRIAIDVRYGVLALADGMGGHRAGEVASRMAANIVVAGLRAHLDAIRPAVPQHSPLLAADKSIKQANAAIYESAQADAARHGMGTTLALAVFHNNSVVLGHIGDSRIYRLRNGSLQLLTRDDSLLRDQVDLGVISAAEAVHSHNRSLVTHALGTRECVEPHLREEQTLPGDLFVLCSDGLNDLVDDADIELIVRSLAGNLALAAQVLVQTAKDNGGYDNVSVIVARVAKPGLGNGHYGWLRRLLPERPGAQ